MQRRSGARPGSQFTPQSAGGCRRAANDALGWQGRRDFAGRPRFCTMVRPATEGSHHASSDRVSKGQYQGTRAQRPGTRGAASRHRDLRRARRIFDQVLVPRLQTGAGADALLLRPGLASALKVARTARSALIVSRLDRLSRNVHFISGLMEHRVHFIVAAFGKDCDDFVLHIYASLAEQERKLIAERCRAVAAVLKAKGKKFGFARSKAFQRRIHALALAAQKKATMERSEAYRAHIEWALRQPGVNGRPITFHAAAKNLNDRNIESCTGGRWVGQQLLIMALRLGIHHARRMPHAVARAAVRAIWDGVRKSLGGRCLQLCDVNTLLVWGGSRAIEGMSYDCLQAKSCSEANGMADRLPHACSSSRWPHMEAAPGIHGPTGTRETGVSAFTGHTVGSENFEAMLGRLRQARPGATARWPQGLRQLARAVKRLIGRPCTIGVCIAASLLLALQSSRRHCRLWAGKRDGCPRPKAEEPEPLDLGGPAGRQARAGAGAARNHSAACPEERNHQDLERP